MCIRDSSRGGGQFNAMGADDGWAGGDSNTAVGGGGGATVEEDDWD